MKQVYAKLTVAAEKDDALNKKKSECQNQMKAVDTFLDQVFLIVFKAESMKADEKCDDMINSLDGFSTTAEHHLSGGRIAKKRYEGLLNDFKES